MREILKKCWAWLMSVKDLFLGNNCSMHAAGLTYYILLAIVPVLCVLLAAAKELGADEFAKEKIHTVFESQISQFELDAGLAETKEDAAETAGAPDAAETESAAQDAKSASEDDAAKKLAATQAFIAQAREIEGQLLDQIEKFHVGTLGWIGFAMLVWTVISSIGMIELSFNEIWGVKKPRAIWHRAALDFTVALVMPVLATLALSVPLLKIVKDVIVSTAGSLWLTKWVSDGAVWLIDSWAIRTAVTLFFATLVFFYLFKVMPHCHVKTRAAFRCGFVTAVFFGIWMKICAVAQVGIAKSSAVYGSFAFLPIVLTWLFMSWQIILLGCCMVRASADPSVKSLQSGDNPAP